MCSFRVEASILEDQIEYKIKEETETTTNAASKFETTWLRTIHISLKSKADSALLQNRFLKRYILCTLVYGCEVVNIDFILNCWNEIGLVVCPSRLCGIR